LDIFIFKALWPEIFLSLFLIKLLVLDSHIINRLNFNFPILNNEIIIQLIIVFFFILLLINNDYIFGFDSNFFFLTDLSTKTLKLFFIVFCLFSFIIIWRSFFIQKLNFFEFFLIFLIVVISLLLLTSAFNLISIYLCLELQALSFYIFAAFNKDSILSSEAAIKYFISSSIMSGVFLLGCSFIYGCFGTLNLIDINILISNKEALFTFNYEIIFIISSIGAFLILSTIFFKLVIAPYHFWFPQIYDGAPLSSTIIFSILPKLMLFNLLLKVWVSFFNLITLSSSVLFLIGFYSIFFGLIKLLKQKRLKKLYIYSSISQMGLPLCALADNTLYSFSSVYFFLVNYLLTAILMWGILVLINQNQYKIVKNTIINPIFISMFNKILNQNSIIAFCFLVIFFSLAAIPPFSGFIGKVYIYLVLIQCYKYEMALLIIYISVLGVYYYIKFLKTIFFENLTTTIHIKAQSFFNSQFIIYDYNIFSICLYLLIFICFYPTLFFLNCFTIIFYPF
jgi:NADH-quinone oxidoreductase subunit N